MPTATARRGTAASDDRIRDRPTASSAAAVCNRYRPSLAQRRTNSVDETNAWVEAAGDSRSALNPALPGILSQRSCRTGSHRSFAMGRRASVSLSWHVGVNAPITAVWRRANRHHPERQEPLHRPGGIILRIRRYEAPQDVDVVRAGLGPAAVRPRRSWPAGA
jgi:hypothetical protein